MKKRKICVSLEDIAKYRQGLGDIFQALLRDSLELQEMPAPLPRTYDRPEQDAPQRSLSDERAGGAGGDRRDRFYDRDTDYRARDVSTPSDYSVIRAIDLLEPLRESWVNLDAVIAACEWPSVPVTSEIANQVEVA